MIQKTNKHQLGALTGANRCENFYELHFATGEVAHFYILADGIFRFLLDPEQNFNENRTTYIQLNNFDESAFKLSRVHATNDSLIIHAGNYQIIFGQNPVLMSIFDEKLHRIRMAQAKPLELSNEATSETLVQKKNEFYFGGGLQNGYFSHKGRKIMIKHDQITGKGGIPLQVPFFWSNAGYGEIRNTAQEGIYDFGQQNPELTLIKHQDVIFDSFYIMGETPNSILKKYYSLTGQPQLLPKYALGLGHIGNFITTLWQPSQAKERNASRFDNSYYTRTNDPTVASSKASLNGEEDYQFSARGLIDRYKAMNFNLAWLIPNHGVSAVDYQRFNFFNDYAIDQGVQPGFWYEGQPTLPSKSSFSYARNETAIDTDQKQLQSILRPKRPLILRDGGFMGMQNKAALIFGDVGGNWENITTQVAGMIGANLSGQPLVGAAIDGAQGGGNAQIYVRDFQWKTFTPFLFNIDDQSNYSKTPFSYNNKITNINRAYLALHQQLQSYLYTLNAQARTGNPIMQPLFMAFPDERINYTEQFNSEFMLGNNFLIAPITNGREDANCDSRKDNLYLPGKHIMWIDLLTGKKYAGNRVYNNLSFPLWHLPVFVRGGSIFDFGRRNFFFYPQGESETVIYNDDDLTAFSEHHSETHIKSIVKGEKLTITIDPVKGDHSALKTDQETQLTIMCDSYSDQVTVKINDQVIQIQQYGTIDAFNHAREGIFYNTNYALPEFAPYLQQGQTAFQIKLANRNITDAKIEITINNFSYNSKVMVPAVTNGLLPSPKLPSVDSNKISAHSFELTWSRPGNVEVEINHLIYKGISGKSFTFHELTPNNRYIIRMRYVAGNKVSEWSDLFGVITKHEVIKNAIADILVTSNCESNSHHPLTYLTDLKLASEWQTNQVSLQDNPLKLTFTFDKVENLSRMVFVPRNIDHKANPVDVSILISPDGKNFTSYIDHLQWKADSKNKVVGLRDVTAKAIELVIYQSSGSLVAAREIFFYRAKK
ncbi:alpha-glucosidase [Lactobacillus sp. ESL0233]|uniref:TIM-barrel domain-containing protein n=1 Tax=Lactobacillus sp. ESL0233 TaxID=2069354 RepID=UPI000EFD54EA|nr:TIM-barrel domain-containing protein [Lactobacillus sp. ESL0233]RMC40249.1 alpha-glucosidase [Lactobacillus sp. ESL0233]